MKRYNWSNKDKVVTIFLIVCLVVLWSVIVVKGTIASRYKNQTAALNARIFAVQNKIDYRQRELNYKLQKQAINSPNTSIRESTQQIVADRKVQAASRKLFKILYTFDSHDSYVARGKKASHLVTDDLRKNEHIFPKNDDDGTGHSFINASGQHEKFMAVDTSIGIVEDGKVPVLAKVTEESYIMKGKQPLDKGQSQVVYSGTYDLKANKFSDLNAIHILSVTAVQN